MKKVFLVLPLAIVLANCSSTRNTNSTSANSGVNASIGATAGTGVNSGASTSGTLNSSSTASTDPGTTASNSATATTAGSGSMGSSGTMGSSSMNSSAKNNANWSSGSKSGMASDDKSTSSAKYKSSGSINWDVYDPNNYMQNPERYRKPYEIEKAGGWTYSKDWRRNTNFTADAMGEWQLTITPEVAAYWQPDTRRPETYASFWTPEAVMARYQATVAAIQKSQDSIAALNATTAGTNTMGNADAKTSETANANTSTTITGSGSTGTMGTGGTSSATSDPTANAGAATTVNSSLVAPFTLTAVNGNNYMLPKLNLFIDNGSFTAYTGCNNAIGKIVVNGSALHFEEANPSTNVECIGGFDQSAFVDRLRRADSYDVVNNQFRLKKGEQVLMTFAKNTTQKY
ncbi:MAG: META domain-containing protein [Segetibacter sp.]